MDVRSRVATNLTTDRLKRAYRKVMIQINRSLTQEQYFQLVFYCRDDIRRDFSSDLQKENLKLFQCLEDEAKISWNDVSFLKEGMHVIGRDDLVKELATFEVKRDLTKCLEAYAGRDSTSSSYASLVSKTAENLAQQMAAVRDKVDIENLVIKSGKDDGAKELWLAFADAVIGDGTSFTWSKLALLVAIEGEVIAAASSSEDGQDDGLVGEMPLNLANKLSPMVAKLGSWEEFCAFVRKEYHPQDKQYDCRSSVQRQIADAVKQMEEHFGSSGANY